MVSIYYRLNTHYMKNTPLRSVFFRRKQSRIFPAEKQGGVATMHVVRYVHRKNKENDRLRMRACIVAQ